MTSDDGFIHDAHNLHACFCINCGASDQLYIRNEIKKAVLVYEQVEDGQIAQVQEHCGDLLDMTCMNCDTQWLQSPKGWNEDLP